jgi:hypothetical protein
MLSKCKKARRCGATTHRSAQTISSSRRAALKETWQPGHFISVWVHRGYLVHEIDSWMFAEYGKEYALWTTILSRTWRAKEIELDGTRTGQERGNTESGLRLPDLEHASPPWWLV